MNSSHPNNFYDQLSNGYRNDQILGTVYDHTPSSADDLTAIRGIDTREAVILNRLGIYFFPQIALWTHRQTGCFADELGMSRSTLVDEQWIQQAQTLSRPRPTGPSRNSAHLPASAIRTVSMLSCALIVGCLMVYWLSLRSSHPLTGVLSADITSLRVPTESRLIASHVVAGEEVFSGDELLTLEKVEHLTMIETQERRVQELARQLQQAEAQASLDLEWRTRELDREISDVRSRSYLIQEVKRPAMEPLRSAAMSSPNGFSPFKTVSQERQAQSRQATKRPATPNTMIFVSGETGESSVNEPRPAKNDPVPMPRMIAMSEPTKSPTKALLQIEERDMESRLSRLEQLRDVLPQQVRRAAGVESVRVQYEEADQRLNEIMGLSRNVSVQSPAYGKIGHIRYKAGDTMSPGEVMLKILHTDRRYILVLVPTGRVNEVQPGMTVGLVFPGNEFYRGKIANLPMLAESNTTGGQSYAPVRVAPVGKLWPEIPIGSQVSVIVDSDRVF